MKKTIIISILILLLIGVGYLGLWVIGGMGVGSGGNQESMNNTKNTDSQTDFDANGRGDEGFGDESLNIERSGIVIDKDLLNKKIVIPTGEAEKNLTSTSTKVIATSTEMIATSTTEIKPNIASTTDGIKTASSSLANPSDSTQDASSTEEIPQ